MKKKVSKAVFRVVLFLCLSVCLIATGSLVEITGTQKSEFASVKDFYKSERFANEMDVWAASLQNYWKYNASSSAGAAQEEAIAADTAVYELGEYDTLLTQLPDDTKANDAETESLTLWQTMDWETYQEQQGEVSDQILIGNDAGTEYYFFYDQLREYCKYKLQTKDVKKFVHLTGTQYYVLLKEYANADALDSKKRNSSVSRWYSQIADEYAQAGGFGYYNPKNQNLIAYCPDSAEGAESDDTAGTLCLATQSYEFSYAAEDVGRNQDYYFPAELLDYSSRENFQKSIITTPFTTVEEPMAFLGMQEFMQYTDESWGDEYYDEGLLNEVYYRITYERENTADKELGEFANCDDQEWENADFTLTYQAADGQYDAKTRDALKNGDYQLNDSFAQSLKEMYGVTQVAIGIHSDVALNSLSMARYETFVWEHAQAYMAAAVVGGIFFLLLLVVLLVRQPAVLYAADRHYLLTKTVALAAVGVVFGLLFAGAVTISSNLQLSGLGIVFGCALPLVVAAFLVYLAALEYLLSFVRLCRAGAVRTYLWCWHIGKKWIVGGASKIVRAGTQMWRNRSVAWRSAALVAGYLAANAFLLLLGAMFGSVVLSVLFCLAGNVWVMYMVYRDMRAMDTILAGIQQVISGDLSHQIEVSQMHGHKKELAQAVNRIGEGLEKSVAASLRDERLKTELITNVSHDIKTPLTSIISYVDLLKREGLSEEPVKGYIAVLDQKSQRLKQLIEDLVEVSKASTGNIELTPVNLDMTELVKQAIGEFEDKYEQHTLELIKEISDAPAVIWADGRRCYRILENLFQNVYKYAMPGTRVYLSLCRSDGTNGEERIVFCLKNISQAPLNIAPEELTQRFVRGEESRTSEGSGLGLSIAQSLTVLQKGTFTISMDGDLFKVTVSFPAVAI